MACQPITAAFSTPNPETLELEGRCVLTDKHINVDRAFANVSNTLVKSMCWDKPVERFERIDRFYADSVRISDFDYYGDFPKRQVCLRKHNVVSQDLEPQSEFWKGVVWWPKFRISLSREEPVAKPPKSSPKLVRRKETVSCFYKQGQWRFDVSKVSEGNRKTLELEIECQSLEMDPETLQRSMLMKLADLSQMAASDIP